MTDKSARKTILVVDDDEHLRLLCQTCLRYAEYSVVTAVSAQQALARLAASKVDLVILDVDLNDRLDGVDVLKRIKADPATAHLPVMILSAHNQQTEIERGVEAGADYYMTKPYEVSEIIANVRRILAAHESAPK
jgi:DNA-binding response OmpR family regulator